jgi:cobalt-precorrin-5B (C1)-methyltransferase
VTEPELREPDLPRTAKVRTGPAAQRLDDRHLQRRGGQGGDHRAAHPGAAVLGRGAAAGGPGRAVRGRALRRAPDSAEAVVVKDAGDDPDVTHGAHLTARVRWDGAPGVRLEGGVGVGVVTKEGLGLEVGGPAINPVPGR